MFHFFTITQRNKNTAQDVEKAIPHDFAIGFPAVAAFLARDPDHETYVFRKYSYLAARNLVFLQNELLRVETQLKNLDKKVELYGDLQTKLSWQNWEEFQRKSAEQGRDEQTMKLLADELQVKLCDYQNALLQTSQVADLQPPSQRVLDVFRSEFQHMQISGHAAKMLENRDDLAALHPAKDKDILSNFLREHWPFSSYALSSSYYSQAHHFENRHLQLVVSAISLAISSILLAGSIVTLYFITEPNARLGLLIMFIVLFAIGIRISTSASRDSIFAATAAYAAVLVVFVSGNLGNVQTP